MIPEIQARGHGQVYSWLRPAFRVTGCGFWVAAARRRSPRRSDRTRNVVPAAGGPHRGALRPRRSSHSARRRAPHDTDKHKCGQGPVVRSRRGQVPELSAHIRHSRISARRRKRQAAKGWRPSPRPPRHREPTPHHRGPTPRHREGRINARPTTEPPSGTHKKYLLILICPTDRAIGPKEAFFT